MTEENMASNTDAFLECRDLSELKEGDFVYITAGLKLRLAPDNPQLSQDTRVET